MVMNSSHEVVKQPQPHLYTLPKEYGYEKEFNSTKERKYPEMFSFIEIFNTRICFPIYLGNTIFLKK